MRIQEGKLGEGLTAEDVRTWTEKIKKDDIAPIEEAVLQLETVLENVKQDKLRRKEGLAAQAREGKAQEQSKYDKKKFELQFNYEKKLNEKRKKLKSIEQGLQKPNARLQKLQITKLMARTLIGYDSGISLTQKYTPQIYQQSRSFRI